MEHSYFYNWIDQYSTGRKRDYACFEIGAVISLTICVNFRQDHYLL